MNKTTPEAEFLENILKDETYNILRNRVGWNPILDNLAETALRNSLYTVMAIVNDRPVAMGRVIGDGARHYYIQDVVVDPEFQRQGFGTQIMNHIKSWLKHNAHASSFIGLMAAKDAAPFYLPFGFKEREENRPGMYQWGRNLSSYLDLV